MRIKSVSLSLSWKICVSLPTFINQLGLTCQRKLRNHCKLDIRAFHYYTSVLFEHLRTWPVNYLYNNRKFWEKKTDKVTHLMLIDGKLTQPVYIMRGSRGGGGPGPPWNLQSLTRRYYWKWKKLVIFHICALPKLYVRQNQSTKLVFRCV